MSNRLANDTLPMLAMPSTTQLDALELIAHGSTQQKLSFIAAHAPEELDDHLFDWNVDYVDRDSVAPIASKAAGTRLDAVIARIALGMDVPRAA